MSLGAFAIPGDLNLPTGGYGYDRAMLAALPELELVHLTDLGLDPDNAALERAARELAGTGPIVIDGLALGVLPAALLNSLNRPIIALCHHPLGLETGLAPDQATRLMESERAALSACAAVITTSERTGQILRTQFDVNDPVVIEPGIALRPVAARGNTPPTLLTLASFTPRKGHDVLLGALERVADLPWQAVWAGAEPDEAWLNRIEEVIAASGLGARITRRGPVSDKARDEMLAGADLFVLPTHYEGYGMVFAEAMMAGLPILACAGGAVPDVVPGAAGHIVEPGDVVALGDRLRALLTSQDQATRMAAAARAHALTLPSWSDQAALFAATIKRIAQ
ncbi:glycosyltransferase family 4 protein [Pontivivens insulae]|uniref:GDP-mannose-dependent alpha-(1-6)-phosphatidylinositol monomannoside mannosyltransferase n=1 Tax=Pontivivens insulae TaxID=1639689 RepID=A0A2R8AFL8_9RHOB|nr:glycosyltransferase family 4 protein [Pontivivens insulae]RED12109.1 glycosyltransferase involved in cell wall biosynthesis [Pontivivens insulae]SPF30865.1 GDP-mannose-dependent alpha-(1-6)-phosphatidylinositol monomannoside mannosyltransferase [Pontivivens insulae]